MINQVYVSLLFILSSVQYNGAREYHFQTDLSDVSSRDLLDEVKAQIEDLRAIVRERISTGFSDIDNRVNVVLYYRDQSIRAALMSIQQQYQTFNGQLTTIKDLAETAEIDITFCLEQQKFILDSLPQHFADDLQKCLHFANTEVEKVRTDSRYFIDIIFNEVEALDYQLDVCKGDFLCISPVITQVELAMTELPEKIAVEVARAADLITKLRVLISQCTESRVAQMSSEGNTIVATVSDCANGILP